MLRLGVHGAGLVSGMVGSGALGGYNDLVLGTGPIAYWPQSETSGLVAHCLVNPAQNGTYAGVTLANDATGPFGTPAPYYDGTNDYLNPHSAALQAAWPGQEGTALIWLRMVNVGVWTDATINNAWSVNVDAANYWYMTKAAANNTLSWAYRGGGGAIQTHNLAGLTDVDWMCLAMTWTVAGNLVAYYRNSVPLGSDAGIGAWAGAPVNNEIMIGAFNNVPLNPHHGWLGPCALWDRALGAGEIADLYVT